MTIEIYTLSEDEQQVIEDAIEYVNQLQHGLYKDVKPARDTLVQSVETLVMEHDGRWQPQIPYTDQMTARKVLP